MANAKNYAKTRLGKVIHVWWGKSYTNSKYKTFSSKNKKHINVIILIAINYK